MYCRACRKSCLSRALAREADIETSKTGWVASIWKHLRFWFMSVFMSAQLEEGPTLSRFSDRQLSQEWAPVIKKTTPTKAEARMPGRKITWMELVPSFSGDRRKTAESTSRLASIYISFDAVSGARKRSQRCTRCEELHQDSRSQQQWNQKRRMNLFRTDANDSVRTWNSHVGLRYFCRDILIDAELSCWISSPVADFVSGDRRTISNRHRYSVILMPNNPKEMGKRRSPNAKKLIKSVRSYQCTTPEYQRSPRRPGRRRSSCVAWRVSSGRRTPAGCPASRRTWWSEERREWCSCGSEIPHTSSKVVHRSSQSL